ncbi:sulfurtransferase [Pseudonocardia dioxanivorans]|jgi:thiosulfate/3-mercaptopyruvate sulfurtransferase|uniref:sulfurtransferase n=1 Tax=Pseudonocardia dioxanivorans TaxID=240495 RepID=UPI000CCFDB31|nr:sulfurtransferase [Pseudonocardia dioxanivorans]
MSDVLISVDELADLLDSAAPPVVLDVRWKLGDPHGRQHYLDGHLPGAVYVDLESELAAPHTPAQGRHPLPAVEDLQRSARRWGVDDDRLVVAYDDVGNLSAARLWWLLRWGGHTAVRLLDGGLPTWTGSGRALDTGDVVPGTGSVGLVGGRLPVLEAGAVATFPDTGVLLDARAGERYRGETEPVDPRAGHIPGAISAPTGDNLDGSGRFLPADELRRRFASLGVAEGVPTSVYCGSGVTAAHQIAALRIAGVEGVLYPGSWSQWSADPARPAATGPEPR